MQRIRMTKGTAEQLAGQLMKMLKGAESIEHPLAWVELTAPDPADLSAPPIKEVEVRISFESLTAIDGYIEKPF